MKKYKRFFNESILDTLKKELSPNIFKNEKMKPEVSKYIIDTFTKWLSEVAPEVEIVSISLIGSSAGYRYNDTSDIDLNCKLTNITPEKMKEIFAIRPNGNFLPGTEMPINYFLVTDDKAIEQADNVYDLQTGEWIKPPMKDEATVPYSYIVEIAKIFISGIDNRILEYEADVKELAFFQELLKSEDKVDKDDIMERIALKEEEIKSDLDAIKIGHHVINAFRGEAFDDEFDTKYMISIESPSKNAIINNLVYKVLEQFGYFEKLKRYEDIRKKMMKK